MTDLNEILFVCNTLISDKFDNGCKSISSSPSPPVGEVVLKELFAQAILVYSSLPIRQNAWSGVARNSNFLSIFLPPWYS